MCGLEYLPNTLFVLYFVFSYLPHERSSHYQMFINCHINCTERYTSFVCIC